MICIKRAYEAPAKSDGVRILVDRLWPRGVGKESLEISFWMKDLGPSNTLRRWFGHDPEKWDEFRKRYLKELKRPEAVSMLREIAETAREGTVTLIYGAKDEEHNQAVVLKQAIESL